MKKRSKSISAFLLTASFAVASTVLAASFCQAAFALSSPNLTPAPSAPIHNFTQPEISQIETIIHDYLIKNPQVLVETAKALQKQEEAAEQQRANDIKMLAIKYSAQIFDAKSSNHIAVGSATPKVMIAEFFSYQCPVCRSAFSTVEQLYKDDKDIQFIFINWPFEGDDDVYAAKVALASKQQGKSYDIHRLLLNSREAWNQERINKAAQSLGMDMTKLEQDVKNDILEKALSVNSKLAQNLKLSGVPVFFITNNKLTKIRVILGRASMKDLQKAISEVL